MKKLESEGKGYFFNGDQPISEWQFKHCYKMYQEESGVTATCHQIRHAYCTLLYDMDIDLKSAQYLMGHSDLKTTMDIYTHLSQARNFKTKSILKNLT